MGSPIPEDVKPLDRSRRKIPSWLLQVLGYLISAASLAWVLHGYPIRELLPQIATLDWKWVLIAVGLDLSVYICHGGRWMLLLRPVQRVPFWRTVQSIYIGLFANEVLPLRTGELIRCYLLAHWNHVRISVVFASAAVERMLDGLLMVAAFLITATYVRGLPGYLVDLVRIIAFGLLVAVAILTYIILHKQHAHSVVRESRWAATLRHVVDGLHLMGNWRTLLKVTLFSIGYLFLQVASVWGLMKAYRLDLSFWVAAGVLVIIRFGTVIPNAPGNVGLFQAACVVALTLFGVEKNDAKTFSFVMFFALTLPLLIGGAVAVALTGLNLGEIHHHARRGLRDAHLQDPGHPRH